MPNIVIVRQPHTSIVVEEHDTDINVTEESTKTVQIAAQGPQGIPGTATGGDKHFTLDFSATNSIAVNHNLGKYPAVNVLDSAGDDVEGNVEYNTINSLTVSFSAPFSGKVICN